MSPNNSRRIPKERMEPRKSRCVSGSANFCIRGATFMQTIGTSSAQPQKSSLPKAAIFRSAVGKPPCKDMGTSKGILRRISCSYNVRNSENSQHPRENERLARSSILFLKSELFSIKIPRNKLFWMTGGRQLRLFPPFLYDSEITDNRWYKRACRVDYEIPHGVAESGSANKLTAVL